MGPTRILLVDDDSVMRDTLAALLGGHGFRVRVASNVPGALKLILSEEFDVLLSDLHMPGAGDGLTVVSAMRHANPRAVTMLLSAFPEMTAAAQAILAQTDAILVKPIDISALVGSINERLKAGAPVARDIQSVATILEESIQSTISTWYESVEEDERLTAISLSREQRTGHLPQILLDLVDRLNSDEVLGTGALVSQAAQDHGSLRREQGYSAAMLVEESRLLQRSIFGTLRKNYAHIDFSVLLDGVMKIADEVDSQLSQAMQSYMGGVH